MKNYIIIFLSFFTVFRAFSQSPHTVCIGNISKYWVQGDSASNFTWWVDGGSIISLPFDNDTVEIKWGIIPGNFTVKVLEKNNFGCMGDTVFSDVLILPWENVTITGPNEICKGDYITLIGSSATNYKWNTGSNNQSITDNPVINTSYWLMATNICGTDTAYHNVIVNPNPVANFVYNPLYPLLGEMVNLIYTGTSVSNYFWYDKINILPFSNSISPNYTIINDNQTEICISVVDNNGCPDSICKTIITNGIINIWIPNTFSPNGDGLNEIFKAEASTVIEDFQLYIYNRWGQQIFESKDINIGWDGKYLGNEVQPGVYTWTLTYQAKKHSKIVNRKSGYVTLIK